MAVRWLVLLSFFPLLATAQTPPAQISGHVVRADTGGRLAKAIVSLYPQQANLGEQRTVRTTADGAFTFTGLLAGTYAVSADLNGFVAPPGPGPSTRPLSVGAGQQLTQVEVRLIPAGVISGTVIDEDRDPIARVAVTALRANYLAGGTPSWSYGGETITDDQGNFRLSGLGPGPYFLRAGGLIRYSREAVPLKQSPDHKIQYRETYYPDSALSEVGQPLRIQPGSEIAGLRISLRTVPTYTVNGRIEPAADAAAKDIRVAITRRVPVQETFNLREYAAQGDGSFTIPGLEPGEYVLTARTIENGRFFEQGYTPVQIVDANIQAVIRTGSGPEVRGKVTLDGAPFPAGWQIAVHAEHSWSLYPSPVDADGNFDIRRLPPGRYYFQLNRPRSAASSIYLKRVSCSGVDFTTQAVNLDLSTLLDKCEVTLAPDAGTITGVASPGAIAVLIPQSRDLRRIPRYTTFTTTAADGTYRLTGVTPGDYYLLAVPPSPDSPYFAIDYVDLHTDQAQPVTIKPGETQSLPAR